MLERPEDGKKQFLSNPKVTENLQLLTEIGMFDFVDSLCSEIENYKRLLSRSLDIFDCTNIDEIMDSIASQISDHFFSSSISFVWKPVQSREDVRIKSYKGNEPVNVNIKINFITPFESFFNKYPEPVKFELLAGELEDAAKSLIEIKPEIISPILGPFGLYGIILIGKKNNKTGYSTKEFGYIKQFMSFVSQAFKNHLHYQHSLHDVKTGLYNHGFFMTRLSEEISRAKRNEFSSSVLVIDVDRFKNFNDNYGHLAGDKVLEHLAALLKKTIRKNDIPSRFGGEEFTVLLPETGWKPARDVAERIRIRVSEMEVPWEVPLPKITVSLGIFSFDQDTNLDIDKIIQRADEALYASKRQGRNRSTVWTPELQQTIENLSDEAKK